MSAKKHRYAATASTVYFSYFMMGIGMSLLAQFKPQFASLWHSSISGVLSVVSAVGIGGIVSVLITGPISDHFGRRASAVIGHLLWAIYYIGLLYAPNFAVAYIIGILGGIANSFLNASNFPALMEIFPESASVAGLMSKFAINIGQFCLPLAILLGTALGSGYRTVFMLAGILYTVMALILAFSPYPGQVSGPKKQEKAKHDFNLGVWSLVLMGFTSTAAFLLWINTYQELAKSYGIANPSSLQSVYAVGASIAVLFNSFIIKKGVKEIDILIWYPPAQRCWPAFGLLHQGPANPLPDQSGGRLLRGQRSLPAGPKRPGPDVPGHEGDCPVLGRLLLSLRQLCHHPAGSFHYGPDWRGCPAFDPAFERSQHADRYGLGPCS